VPLAVTGPPGCHPTGAERTFEIDYHPAGGKIGLADIVDHDVVGTAEGMEGGLLDVISAASRGGGSPRPAYHLWPRADGGRSK
jgi:hypothetical protein